MRIYTEKIRKYISQSGMTNISIAKKLNISKPTFYKWLSEENITNESNIRNLSKIINAPVNDISGLDENDKISERDFSESIRSIYDIGDINPDKNLSSSANNIIKYTMKMEQRLNNASIIIKGLLQSMNSIFYIKDTKLKYIITSKSFITNLSLQDSFDPLGLDDEYFFPKKEAVENENEDNEVLISGNSVINREGFIPGSRKKKWGIYSKTPILDKENKTIGLLCIINEITEKRKIEEIREQLEIALNVMSEGIIIYSLETHEYLYATKTALDMRGGLNFKEIHDMSFEKRLKRYVHPEDRNILKVAHKERNWDDVNRIRIRNSQGEYRWFEFSYSKAKFMGKECIVSIQKDIAEKVELENARENFKSVLSNVAKKLKIGNIDINAISNATGLTIEEIKLL